MAKTLALKLTLSGQDIVQFNGNKDGYLRKRCENRFFYDDASNKNMLFAKVVIEKVGVDDSGKDILNQYLKISGDGLRHAIHIKEHPIHIPDVCRDKEAYINFVANLGTLQRGFLIADGASDFNNLKRSSAYCLTDAIDYNTPIKMDVHSRSGEKKKKTEDVDSDNMKGDTTLTARENAGKTQYHSTGFINLSELSFIPMGIHHDRQTINEGIVDEYRTRLGHNLRNAYERLNKKYPAKLSPNFISEVPAPSYYKRTVEDAYAVPEMGILLTNEQLQVIVLDLLDKINNIFISKSQGAYAYTTDLQIKAIDEINDMKNDDGFFTLDEFELNNLCVSYVPHDGGNVRLKELENAIKCAEAKAKESDEKKKADKKTKKPVENKEV